MIKSKEKSVFTDTLFFSIHKVYGITTILCYITLNSQILARHDCWEYSF